MNDRPIPSHLPDNPPERSAQDPQVPLAPPVPASEPSSTHARQAQRVLYGRLAVGVGVILIGLVSFFPGLFGFLTRGEIWRLWPVILIGFGVLQLVQATNTKERHGAAWLLGSGIVLLIHFLPSGVSWGRGWPLWIIAAGLIDLSFPEKARDRATGLFLLALGGYLLLIFRPRGVPEHLENAWPVLVVLFGLVLVWQALFTTADGKRPRRRRGRTPSGDSVPSQQPEPRYRTEGTSDDHNRGLGNSEVRNHEERRHG